MYDSDSLRNIKKQGTKILRDIADSYEKGRLDDPAFAANFAALLACICEGKITGLYDEPKNQVLWSLTPEYEKELAAARAKTANLFENIVKGPW